MAPASTAEIRADFDRIARLAERYDQRLEYYDQVLLRRAPTSCETALEIGCGTGAFTLELAARAKKVVALDLSPGMIEVARRRSAGLANIEFVIADAATWDFGREHYDCIASITTLHHLPMADILRRAREALKPGGVLLVLDLFQPVGLADFVRSALARSVRLVLDRARTGRWRAPAEIRRAWADHERLDHHPPMAEVRRLAAEILPGARVTQRLLWRYSLIWSKPTQQDRTGS